MGGELDEALGLWRRRHLGHDGPCVSAPTTSGAATSKSQRSANTTRCEKVAKGHAKVTAADIAACKASSVKLGGHCPTGSHAAIVRVNNKFYGLTRGHKPLDIGTQPGMGTFNRVCGPGKAPATVTPTSATTATQPPFSSTTTTRPPSPTTTTTRPPPPPTTTTTTAAPAPTPTSAGCYIDPEGNCYRAGEYCPDSLHGQTVQGESGPIICEDNNGWRWEPA